MAQEGELFIQKLNGELMFKNKELEDLTLTLETYK